MNKPTIYAALSSSVVYCRDLRGQKVDVDYWDLRYYNKYPSSMLSLLFPAILRAGQEYQGKWESQGLMDILYGYNAQSMKSCVIPMCL